MILVEQHIINKKHSFYNECDLLCFKSKNIYNQSLYNIRQYYFTDKKYLNYETNYHIVKNQESYSTLPTKVSCQTIKMVDHNFKSFFQLLNVGGMNPKIPKYLDKDKGRFVTKFPKQSLELRTFKKIGKIKLSQTNILISTNVKDFDKLKEVRIIPRNNFYIIEVVYQQNEIISNGNVTASIDVGLNNLATITFSNGNQPLIINGKPLKSINQFYNKKKASLQSILEKRNKKKKSKQLYKLTEKRNRKVKDYLHKCSKELVNQLVYHNVNTLVLGKNINMKQDINLGKKNNQNFTQIPIFRFLDIISYKAKLKGINIIFQEESYTSKCSFLDNEPIMKHESYQGKRIKRGLFKASNGRLINADVNGSYNIMKKAFPNVFTDGIEGFGVNPLVIKTKNK
jgi:putative transposase